MDSYGLRYDRTLVQVSYVEEKFLKHFSYHLLVHWSPASRPAFLSYRKLRFYTIKNAPRGSHFGGVELCRLRDPPQAENVPRHILNHIFFINGGRGWKNTEASFWLLPELWTA